MGDIKKRRLSQSVFRTKTSSDNKVCEEREHRIRLLIFGVFRDGRKKHSKDNEKNNGKMEKPLWPSHRPWRVSPICIGTKCLKRSPERRPSRFEFYPFLDHGSRKPKISIESHCVRNDQLFWHYAPVICQSSRLEAYAEKLLILFANSKLSLFIFLQRNNIVSHYACINVNVNLSGCKLLITR